MSTKITRFRNLLIMALVCFVSGSVWGQGSETFENITSSVSNYNNPQNWTGDNGAAWATTKARTDQKINGTRGITFNAANSTITGNLTQEQQNNGVGIVTFLVQSLASSDKGEMSFTVTAGSSSKDVTVNITGKGSPAVTATVELKSSDASSIIIKTNGKLRYTIDDISWTANRNLETPTFKFNGEASYTIILGEAFTAPTLTNSSDATPIYESSNTNVATVNANTGEVEILARGTTIIKASIAETETYSAATTSYSLTVKEKTKPMIAIIYFKETFNQCNGEGGNDDKWSSINPLAKEIAGWNGNLYEANQCIKVGASGTLGSVTTPSLGINGNAELIFKAGAWKDDNKTLKLSIEGEGTLSVESVEMENELFSTYTVNISDANINTKIKFEGFTAKNSRFFLDDIFIVKEITAEEMNNNNNVALIGTWTKMDIQNLSIPENVTSIDMTEVSTETIPSTLNKNCLFYVNATSELSNPNVIKIASDKTATAENIMLEDNYNFNNIMPFTATAITYSRTFASGWNTFALPFNTAIPNGVQVEAFDKKDGNQILFTEATSIEANTAYLINVQAGGEISFAANNVTVPVTATTGDTYKSNFLHMTGDDIAGKYILVMEEGVEVFARANAEAQMHAFRGYLDLPTASGVQYSISHDGGATDINNTDIEGIKIYSINGTLIINADKTQSVQIYGLDGRMVKNIQVSEGENTVTGLAKGIYLINNQKAIIK